MEVGGEVADLGEDSVVAEAVLVDSAAVVEAAEALAEGFN